MYWSGTGVKKDFQEAAKWYRKAADQGNAKAMVGLGFVFMNGYGVEKDYGEALTWFRKANDQNDGYALLRLAWVYEYGWCDVKKDENEALKLRSKPRIRAIPSASARWPTCIRTARAALRTTRSSQTVPNGCLSKAEVMG